jgi:hypothetical protein
VSLRVDVSQLIELAVVVSPGGSSPAVHCKYPKFQARRNPVLKTDQSFDSFHGDHGWLEGGVLIADILEIRAFSTPLLLHAG